jgi:hypothetical protein
MEEYEQVLAGRTGAGEAHRAPTPLLFALLFQVKRLGGTTLSPGGVRKLANVLSLGLVLAFALLGMPGALLRWRTTLPGSVAARSLAVFAAGFAGMSMQLVLLLRLQLAAGNLYVVLGLTSSLFMTGVFLAGILVLAHPRQATWFAPVCGVAAAGVALGAGWIPIPGIPAFCLAFLVNGLAFGLFFQLAAKRRAGQVPEAAKTASLLDLADHFGGVAGGLLSGVLLLPVAGPLRVAVVAAVAALAAGCLLWPHAPRH